VLVKRTLIDVSNNGCTKEDFNMKPLSESLMDLAGRVKRLEDAAGAVREKNRAALQAHREQLEADFDREASELDKTTGEVRGEIRNWWSETKGSIERQIAAMRADFEKRQAAFQQKNAERNAESAEDDAVVAVTLAGYCLDAAEWAVIQAELARGEADELATRS
jgi:hypothetical protein